MNIEFITKVLGDARLTPIQGIEAVVTRLLICRGQDLPLNLYRGHEVGLWLCECSTGDLEALYKSLGGKRCPLATTRLKELLALLGVPSIIEPPVEVSKRLRDLFPWL